MRCRDLYAGCGSAESLFAMRNLPEDERKAYRRLLDEGPLPRVRIQNFPIMTPLQRLYGMTRFRVLPKTLSENEVQAMMGRNGPTEVYHLCHDHEPEAVVRAFFDANPRFAETVSLQGATLIFGRHGPEWADAGSKVARELGVANPHAKEVGDA